MTRDKRRKARKRASTSPEKGKSSKESQAPAKSMLREWSDALLFALVVMIIVRTFIFDLFRIPTPSMEKSLLVGDYLFVSKLNYGTRTPITLGIPFTQIYLKGLELPHTRLPGFSSVERGDAIVFNYPPENKPVDRKMHYIKRVVGLPGETIEVRNKVVRVNGEALPLQEGMQQYWLIYKKDERYRLSEARLSALGVSGAEVTSDPKVIRVVASEAAAEEIRSWPYIERVEPYITPPDAGYSGLMYPSGAGYTPDNYGPIAIPAEGQTVELTPESWPIYEPVIRKYEGHTVQEVGAGSYEIDGEPAREYTFSQDYFFVMGDNRDNSEDSRFWGFVPMNHVVGEAVLIYFSWDSDSKLPRFNRLLKLIE